MRGRRGVRRAYSVHHLPTVLNPKHNVIIRGKHPRRRASHSPAFEAIVHRRSRSARYSSAEYSGPQPAPFVRRSRIFAPRFAVAASVRTELKKYEGFANGDASRSRARILSIVRGRLDSRRASAYAPRGPVFLTSGGASARFASWRTLGFTESNLEKTTIGWIGRRLPRGRDRCTEDRSDSTAVSYRSIGPTVPPPGRRPSLLLSTRLPTAALSRPSPRSAFARELPRRNRNISSSTLRTRMKCRAIEPPASHPRDRKRERKPRPALRYPR